MRLSEETPPGQDTACETRHVAPCVRGVVVAWDCGRQQVDRHGASADAVVTAFTDCRSSGGRATQLALARLVDVLSCEEKAVVRGAGGDSVARCWPINRNQYAHTGWARARAWMVCVCACVCQVRSLVRSRCPRRSGGRGDTTAPSSDDDGHDSQGSTAKRQRASTPPG